MRIVYVPLYAETEPFISHKQAQELTCFKNISRDIYWIRGTNSDTTKFNFQTRVLTVAIPEKFENIYSKSKEAFKWLLKNEEFDYLIRTNTSTYFDITRIEDFLNAEINRADFAAGEFGHTRETLVCEKNLGLFLAGTAIVMSRNLVDQIVSSDDEKWWGSPDDIAISAVISDLGIDFKRIPRIDITDFMPFDIGSHYRLKCWSDANRTVERFHEIDAILNSKPYSRVVKLLRFYVFEFRVYKSEFPLGNGINFIRWARQISRDFKMNRTTWAWLLGKNV